MGEGKILKKKKLLSCKAKVSVYQVLSSITKEGRSMGIVKNHIMENARVQTIVPGKGACEEFGQEQWQGEPNVFLNGQQDGGKMACTQPIPQCNGFHDFLNRHVGFTEWYEDFAQWGHVDFKNNGQVSQPRPKKACMSIVPL